MPEGGEPQIPIEAGLIGSVDAGSFVGILRLEAKFVGDPILAIVGTLEFDFVAAAGHHGEEAVAIGYTKRLKSGDWCERKWRRRPDHQKEENGGAIKEPGEHDGGECELERSQRAR